MKCQIFAINAINNIKYGIQIGSRAIMNGAANAPIVLKTIPMDVPVDLILVGNTSAA